MFVVAAWGLCPAFAHAQAGAAPFERLQARTTPGQLIIVTDTSGQKTFGKLGEVSGSSLVIDVRTERPRGGSGPRYSFAGPKRYDAATVQKVARPGPIWDGAVVGALVALIPVVMLNHECHLCTGNGPASAMFLGIGAAAGLGIDAAFGPKTLYKR
jgi:hypothetical protein